MHRRTARLAAAVVSAVAVLSCALVVGAPAVGAATVSFRNAPVASWRLDGVGYATTVVGNTVYVGGQFSTATSPGGQRVSRANLAAFDATTGALRTAFVANTNGPVRALVSDGSRLYVGGSYSSIGGQSRQRLAAVDLTTGSVVGSWSANANSNVYGLAVGGGRLFVGGSFSTLRSTARSRIGAVDLSNGAIVTSFAPTADATVNAVAARSDGSAVYLGGNFSRVDGSSNPYLARVDARGARVPVRWSSVEGPVLALSLRPDGTRLGVGVAGLGNQGAYFDTASGARLWRQRCDGDAQAVWLIGDSMFTGFHEACEGDHSIRLTSNATANGARDRAFRPSFDRFWGVRAIGGTSSVLVVAGDFTRVGGVSAQGFAIFRRS
jgi:hypothetical protein